MSLEINYGQPSDKVPGKNQNCQEFGTYESASSTEDCKTLCHGGRYNGVLFNPCQVRVECRSYLERKNDLSLGKRVLPQVPEHPFGGGSRVIAESRTAQQTANAPTTWGRATTTMPPKAPTAPQGAAPVWGGVTAPGISPTWLPEKDEGIFERLSANIGNGFVAALGWHLWSFAQHVDIFGRR